MQPKAAFKASLFAQEIAGGTCHLWQSVIVTHKGSRCLSKGMGKSLKPRDAFKRRASVCSALPLLPGEEGMQSAAVIACSSCAPFPCQSLNAGYIKMKNARKQGLFIFAFKSPDSKSSGLDELKIVPRASLVSLNKREIQFTHHLAFCCIGSQLSAGKWTCSPIKRARQRRSLNQNTSVLCAVDGIRQFCCWVLPVCVLQQAGLLRS